MAKWRIPDRLNVEVVEDQAPPEYTWDQNDFKFTELQLAYMNGTAMQELMRLLPDYDERHKRAIYSYVIAQLADYAVHCYWEVKHRSEVAH